ncbi:MAG TPA: hypothetical protein VJQ80_11175, partial [Arthrobacter sp.]|nr:hypothetical protein [Arthrobacter sp.]
MEGTKGSASSSLATPTTASITKVFQHPLTIPTALTPYVDKARRGFPTGRSTVPVQNTCPSSVKGDLHGLEPERSPAIHPEWMFSRRFRFYWQVTGCLAAGFSCDFNMDRGDADGL